MPTPIEDIITHHVTNANLQGLEKRFTGLKGTPVYPARKRLYLNEQLDEYIEVANDDVIDEVELAGHASPLVLLLVKPDAQVQHVVLLSHQIEASFLAGAITQRYLSGNRAPGNPWSGSNGTMALPTMFGGCGSFGMACGSMGMACGSFGMACGSMGMACVSFGRC